jgi:D-citramalate synthase
LLAEDATRSDIDYLVKVFQTAVSAGCDRVTPCDTVGYLTPERTVEFYTKLRENLKVPMGVHCHNDFGMAVANTVAALGVGVEECHATINGLGERAGNAALEEIVVALRTFYKLDLGIKTEMLYGTSQLVSRLTGIYTQPNKAVVGENAFTHESGIHTQGVLANPLTYEPIAPELVGCTRRIASGKHSGSSAVRADLTNMGLKPTDEQFHEIMGRIKELGDKGKAVMDADVLAIAETVMGLSGEKPIVLEEMTYVGGNKVTSTASAKIKLNGKEVWGSGIGVGPVDAAINAVKAALSDSEPISLEQYNVKAITGGTDAMVEVVVHLRRGNRTVAAMGVREDIVKASIEAVLSGMNVLKTDYNGKTHKP